ncbi:MAG: ATP-binding cassette domain-containing protein [Pseudomonadota bacterium]
MSDSKTLQSDAGDENLSTGELASSRFVMIVGVTAVLFFLGLLPLEAIPEIPVDIDSKPFFIPLVLIALLPAGRPGLAIGLGVALGEFIRDMMEGYELDDPIGFVGYFVGFALTSFMFGKQPPGKLVILIAALSSAFIQAAIEASSFLLFGEESLGIAIQSTIGNTIMHGVIWGAIPAFFLVPRLQGRFEHFLGFETKGSAVERAALTLVVSDFVPRNDAIAWIKDLYFYYPSSSQPVLDGLSIDLRAGEVLGLMGPSQSGKSTLCRVLAHVAPRATGGSLIGTVELNGEAVDIGYVADNPAAMMTRTRGVTEVEASLDHLAISRSESEARALAALAELGIDDVQARKYIWELPDHQQLLVALAAATAERPKLLILDEVGAVLDTTGLDVLRKTIQAVTARGGAVVMADNDAHRQSQWSDRLALLDEGRLVKVGPSSKVLADMQALGEIGFDQAAKTTAPLQSKSRTTEGPMIKVSMLEFAYEDGPTIWRGADLIVARGEVLGIAGRNGAGKTTLTKLLGGLIKPQSGAIEIHGHSAEEIGNPGRIAVVMHTPSAFFSEPTVRAEIAFALRGSTGGQAAIAERVRELASRFGIADLLDQDPGLLPPGSARMAQIAAVLARGANVLVLDEATIGMDPTERAHCTEMIRDYAQRGGSAIVLDHNLMLLSSVAHRIVLIEDGGLLDAGPPSHAFAKARSAELAALDLEPPIAFTGEAYAKREDLGS